MHLSCLAWCSEVCTHGGEPKASRLTMHYPQLPSSVMRELSTHSQSFPGMRVYCQWWCSIFYNISPALTRYYLTHISCLVPTTSLLVIHSPPVTASLFPPLYEIGPFSFCVWVDYATVCKVETNGPILLFLTLLSPRPSKALKKPSKTCRKWEYFVTNLWPSLCSILGEDCLVICWYCESHMVLSSWVLFSLRMSLVLWR